MIFLYSRSGKTKVFADALGEILGQDVYALECDLDKKGKVGFLAKALALTASGKGTPVSNMPQSMPDEIFLCAPVWGGKIASPARYFLENTNLQNTTVNILLTASMPGKNCEQTMLDILGKRACKPGRVFIFATADKVMPDAETIKEQLGEML